jgi:2-dehydro-3-deoxyphosphogluconate aldolase/(4S)-4-hydroxy-2-oxoglutarate aldolase
LLPAGLEACPVIAILRRLDRDAVRRVVAALAEAGIGVVEITFDSPEVLEYLPSLRAELPSLEIGVGTVLEVEGARRALASGACFLVSPHVDEEIVRLGADQGVAVLPGGATATEVVRAWRAGAAGVKLFPADVLTTATFRALREPLPHIPLIAVGGIDARNALGFLEAGAVAVGIGSWLSARGDAAEAARRASRIVATVRRGEAGFTPPAL